MKKWILGLFLIGCAHRGEIRGPSGSELEAFPPRSLMSVSPPSDQQPPAVQFSVVGDELQVRFEVSTRGAPMFAKEHLGPAEYPFQFDVVEIFIKPDSWAEYYEFELSPFNETFFVRIDFKNGQKKFTNGILAPVTTKTSRGSEGWSATFAISLKELGWSARTLQGNAFAILGPRKGRTYWSLFPLPAGKPNFHSPDHFRSLF